MQWSLEVDGRDRAKLEKCLDGIGRWRQVGRFVDAEGGEGADYTMDDDCCTIAKLMGFDPLPSPHRTVQDWGGPGRYPGT